MKTNYEKLTKYAAGLMAAFLAISPVAFAAVTVGNVFSQLGTNGQLTSVVVVGSGAAASDVAGAADIAVSLAQLSYQQVSTTGSSSNSVNGIEKTQLDINYGNLTDSSANSFPNPIRTFHFGGLLTGSISYKGNTYNYHEAVNLAPSSTAYFSHDFATSGVNGTETLVVPSNSLAYEYVFDTALNCTALATTAQNTCIVGGTLEYTNPVKITMAGKSFVIVGVGANQVTMLSGSVGTATATSGVVYTSGTTSYTTYSDLGNNGNWARVIVKDANGNTVETATINQGDSKDFSTEGITVKVTNVRALQDGTIVGADVVIGPIGSTQITYSTSCSIGGTGSSNTNFPGETNWCIQVGPNNNAGTSFAGTAGGIIAGDKIQVVYKPSTTQYLKWAGSLIKLLLPNNYGEVGFEGYNYNTFASLKMYPVTGQTAYCSIGGGSTNSTICASNLNGIEIDSDTAGTLVDPSTNTGYSKEFFLFNYSFGGTANSIYPVMVGFWDTVNNRIGVNLTTPSATLLNGTYYKVLNASDSSVTASGLVAASDLRRNYYFVFNTTVSYGGGAAAKDQYTLFANISSPVAGGNQASGGSGSASLIAGFTLVPSSTSPYTGAAVCASGSSTMLATECGSLVNWVNTSTTWSTSTGPQFRLYTSDSTDAKDTQSPQVPAGGGATAYSDIGTATQDVVGDSGVIFSAPNGQGTNTVVAKFPAQALQVKAYVGKAGGTTTSTTGTVNQVVPVTSPITVLDTEVTAAQKAKDIVAVGGPCVNSVVADLASSGKFKYTCSGWPGTNFGYIAAIDGAYTVGNQVVVIAGTRAADTRLAADVFMNANTLLAGNTNAAVQVSGTTTAPTITAG